MMRKGNEIVQRMRFDALEEETDAEFAFTLTEELDGSKESFVMKC